MGAVGTCQSSCCGAGFLVDKHFTLFNPVIQRCPSDSGIYCPRGKDLDLDGNASWMFWIPISFRIQAGVFLGFATLEKNTYGSNLMIGERRFVVAKETVDIIHNNFPLKHAPSANPEYTWMHGLMQRNQAVQKDSLFSDNFGDVDQCIIAALDPFQELMASSQSFSKAAVEGSTSDESDLMDFDNEVAESNAHLDTSPHLIHKVDVSSLSRSSRTSLPVSASMASGDKNDGDDGDDKDPGLSDDQTADNIALRTRSSHSVRQSSFSLTREKSASVKPNAPSSQVQSSIKLMTANAHDCECTAS